MPDVEIRQAHHGGLKEENWKIGNACRLSLLEWTVIAGPEVALEPDDVDG
jgi:hypothetical protein